MKFYTVKKDGNYNYCHRYSLVNNVVGGSSLPEWSITSAGVWSSITSTSVAVSSLSLLVRRRRESPQPLSPASLVADAHPSSTTPAIALYAAAGPAWAWLPLRRASWRLGSARRPAGRSCDVFTQCCFLKRFFSINFRKALLLNHRFPPCHLSSGLHARLFTCHLHLFCFRFYLLLLPFGE